MIYWKGWIEKSVKPLVIFSLSRLRRRPRPWPWMNAKKKLLGGMSLSGHAIAVGGITPTAARKFGTNVRSDLLSESIKVPRACPTKCGAFHRAKPCGILQIPQGPWGVPYENRDFYRQPIYAG